MEERNTVREIAWAAGGALFASFVAGLVIAFLDTDIGRDTAANLEGPGRAMIAAPVIVMCLVIFAVCLAALVLPDHRRRLLGVAAITAWLIVAWALMAAVVLAGISYAVNQVDS